jgi:hypothetical protein
VGPTRRFAVTIAKWTRFRNHLPAEVVDAANRASAGGTIDGYRGDRPGNVDALEGALAALWLLLADDLGRPAPETRLGSLLGAVEGGATVSSPQELAGGLSSGDRAEARRLAAVAAGELGAALRCAAMRAETLELGLSMRAEDLDADQRFDDHHAAVDRRHGYATDTDA